MCVLSIFKSALCPGKVTVLCWQTTKNGYWLFECLKYFFSIYITWMSSRSVGIWLAASPAGPTYKTFKVSQNRKVSYSITIWIHSSLYCILTSQPDESSLRWRYAVRLAIFYERVTLKILVYVTNLSHQCNELAYSNKAPGSNCQFMSYYSENTWDPALLALNPIWENM